VKNKLTSLKILWLRQQLTARQTEAMHLTILLNTIQQEQIKNTAKIIQLQHQLLALLSTTPEGVTLND